jgi:hypothetical protein
MTTWPAAVMRELRRARAERNRQYSVARQAEKDAWKAFADRHDFRLFTKGHGEDLGACGQYAGAPTSVREYPESHERTLKTAYGRRPPNPRSS